MSDDNVIAMPGVVLGQPSVEPAPDAPLIPRPDLAVVLRELADAAEAGTLDSIAIAGSTQTGFTFLMTPPADAFAYMKMLTSLDELTATLKAYRDTVLRAL